MDRTRRDGEVTASEVVFEADPIIRVERERLSAAIEGGISWIRVRKPPFAIIIPVAAAGRVVALESYWHGPRERTICFPSGGLPEGAHKFATVARILAEKVGLRATAITFLGTSCLDATQEVAWLNVFVATGCRSVTETFVAPNDLRGEAPSCLHLTVSEVDELIVKGRMSLAVALAAWARFRAADRALPRCETLSSQDN